MRNIDLTNTVDASNQLGDGKFLRFGEVQGSPKILFAGNSMAWHAPKDDIGWSGDWGMAASKRENEHTQDELADKFSELISYLRKGKSKVPVLISQPFLWEKPVVCKAIKKAAAELNAMVMDMSELSQDLSFRAIGKFEHSGVAAHPSDKGMKRIADIIYRNLAKVL